MSPLKKAFALTIAAVILTACQQPKNKRESARFGRGLRGSTQMNKGPGSTNGTCGSYEVQGKYWGEVTATSGDQGFNNELQRLMSPVTSKLAADDKLGFVSGQSGQATGVRFWGNAVPINAQTGEVDTHTAMIRIEIYDDRSCQTKADGSLRPIFPIHIQEGEPNYKASGGRLVDGGAEMVFEDDFGRIIMKGTFNGNSWYGTMSYTLNGDGGGERVLGRFTVPKCGFFVCY